MTSHFSRCSACPSVGRITKRQVTKPRHVLGASIGVLVNVLDPDRVILGGGLGLSEGIYRDMLIAAVRSYIWWAGHRDLPIVPATTGSDAGLIGAPATAWKSVARK